MSRRHPPLGFALCPNGKLPAHQGKSSRKRGRCCMKSIMKSQVILAMSSLALFALAEEPQPKSEQPPAGKPQYERLLQGDDAKRAAELNQQIENAERTSQFDKAIDQSQKLLALRTRLQGADHWETVNERWVLDGRRKVYGLSGENRIR